MSQQIVCDNCDKVLKVHAEHLWIKVGWRVAHPHIEDACSAACARALITELGRDQKRIDREIELENAAL